MKKFFWTLLGTYIVTPYVRAQELIRCPDGTKADPAIGCVETPGNVLDPQSGIAQIILKGAEWLMTFAAGVAVAMLIYGGIRYAMALGEEENIRKAKRTIFWSIFGLAIALLARYVAQFILDILV